MSDAIIYDIKTGRPLRQPHAEETKPDFVAVFNELAIQWTGRPLYPTQPFVAEIDELARQREARRPFTPALPPAIVSESTEPDADPMDLLSRIAARAMEAGADPSAPVSPDHELLMKCDAIVMLKRQSDEAHDIWRGMPGVPFTSGRDREAYDFAKLKAREMAAPLRMLGKMRALTPAGIFAKAVTLRHVSVGGSRTLGGSLADDILNCAELRQAIWPATKEGPV